MRNLLLVLFSASLFKVGILHAENLKIGVLAPLSGKSARFGEFMREGVELARQELAARGKQIELVYEDDQCNAAAAAAGTRKLIEIDKVNGIFGGWCGAAVLAEAPVAERLGMLTIASSIAPQIKNAGRHIYRVQPDASLYIKKLVPYLVQNLKLDTWAVLAHESSFGLGSAEFFAEEMKKINGKIVISESYLPEVTDFRSTLLRIITKNPKGMLLAGYTEAGLIMRQARDLGYTGHFAGLTPFENEDLLHSAGPAAIGAYYTAHFDPENQNGDVINFQARFRTKYGHNAEQFAVVAYEAINIFHELYEKCGNDTECRLKLLDNSSFKGVAEDVRFDKDGDPIRSVYVRQITKSGFVTVK